MTDQEKQVASMITIQLTAVRQLLKTLPGSSTLQGMDPVMKDLIEKLKGPGGDIC